MWPFLRALLGVFVLSASLSSPSHPPLWFLGSHRQPLEKNRSGFTALHLAAERDHVDCLRLIFDKTEEARYTTTTVAGAVPRHLILPHHASIVAVGVRG